MSGARMWPARLPRQVRDNEQRRAEVRVYDALESALGPEWIVFYSRPWLGITPYGEEKDGEADFVVVHPVRGFLTIEVKGGGISWDPETDVWISEDRNRIRHVIKNPVEQARSSKHQLFDKVREMPGWPRGRFIRMRHGVVFPDAAGPPGNSGPDRPRELFCCRGELADIGAWVRNRLSGESAQGPGAGGVQAFVDLLALPMTLRVPPAQHYDEDEQTIAVLTPQQFHILSSFMHLPRAAVGGGAGTGKTIVAMEDASRLAADGSRVVLLCAGKKLAVFLRQTLGRSPVRVCSIDELCVAFAAEAGIRLAPARGLPDDEALDALAKAIQARPQLKFDAVIVDEAQDFRPQWWIVIEELLADPVCSKLHAFYDTNQSVYGDVTSALASLIPVPIRLTRNLRNTQHVHDAARSFYSGFEITADGPEGPVVEWHVCTAASIASNVVAKLRSLTNEDEVHPEKIAILAADDDLVVALGKQTAAFAGVTVAHVRDFKGLEKQVVILAASRGMADVRELAYVALSRPRVHLSIFGEPSMISWLQGAY
ncbi:NERD domain-containing protein [Bradyrhizobium brasilense]|uniref:nuclease-related domain-containing DEAD/DEAH box helicase n=1 Tax=Bradyrhizobium brasilense TaxID=1419277 RepID=UPI0024B27FA4|nr:NERD domain-containing protein [Bradyrhizobium australafricanum]WFU31429.1 NERD domain-containing protein [Bradyrhizobium australafricanum]